MDKKDFLAAELLCFFVGGLGIHRFYTGYIGLGILQLLTAGGCGIWVIIDLVSISTGSYKDANGNKLANYNQKIGYGLLITYIVLIVLTLLAKIYS